MQLEGSVKVGNPEWERALSDLLSPKRTNFQGVGGEEGEAEPPRDEGLRSLQTEEARSWGVGVAVR